MSSSIARFTRLRWPPLMPEPPGEPMRMSSDAGQVELIEHRADPSANLGVAVVGRKPQSGRETEGLADGQAAVDDVLLRDVADQATELGAVLGEVDAVEQDLAPRRADVAGEGFHECRLPRAAGPHQPDELAGLNPHGDTLDQRLVADRHSQFASLDRQAAAIVGPGEIPGEVRGERVTPEADPVARPDRNRPPHPRAVDVGPVRGTQVFDPDPFAVHDDPGVAPRDRWGVDDDVVIGIATDHQHADRGDAGMGTTIGRPGHRHSLPQRDPVVGPDHHAPVDPHAIDIRTVG